MLGLVEPVPNDREEALGLNVGRGVQPRRKRRDGPLVRLEENAPLRAEVLEDGALRDPELGRHVFHPSALVAVLGEVPHRRRDDGIALCLRPRRVPP